ncbi:peptidase T [Planomicrobium sp. CPCC 101079]|uniref:peptidase T n=1 Tax=Planomicrobium sp. CPCC 101079 TaxID=2599618 RepID=UPI0011B4DC6F|nr:peptidase T [Planomicrobium sp. CPCC 101079]TWT16117.1 peptidase T [Planomicrobium sp. CPCC 101079]
MLETLIERLVRYAKIDTQSDFTANSTPSTPGQWDLLRELETEMNAIGLQEVEMDEHGYLFATLPSNTDKDLPVVGFLAHVDTATDFTGKNINPQRVENYDGNDIALSETVVMSPKDFPALKNYVGHTLITTDGTTLLGADNKAGIAEIMTAIEYLVQHPEIKHGKIRVAFTPDEEIGKGPHKFDVARFGADFAYTMDGGPLGELQYESFNAAAAKLTIQGKSVHPGSSKNKMVNASTVAIRFQQEMPQNEVPELTEDYEGFIHLNSFHGDVEKAVLSYIIRYFDKDEFEAKKAYMQQVAEKLQSEYGTDAVKLEIEDQYYNMREKIEPVMEIVDSAEAALKTLGIEPNIVPVRGGTDGSQLSYMGMPTPNIFTGGENYHGKYEFISAENMEKATQVIVEIVRSMEQK